MPTNLGTICADIASFVKDTSPASAVLFRKFVNRSYRDAWARHPWTERVSAPSFITPTAAYSTGTVTVTNGSATVTGSGTTFASWTANTMKFALSVSGVWYGVLSRDSTTQLTLDRPYLGSTASGATYVVYRDVYPLASDVGSLLTMQVSAHKAGHGGMANVSRARAENEWGMPSGFGTPTHFVLHDRSRDTYRIRVGPMVPEDDDFAIRYSYLKDITLLESDGDEPLFHEDKRDILFYGGLGQAYALHGRMAEAREATMNFERLIAAAWSAERAAHPVVVTLRSPDRPVTIPWPPIQFPVVAP